MIRDSRLSVALHVLLHMKQMGRAVTSEALGSMMDVNPVVIRRTLGGLRDARIVAAEKGHGGGWSLARDLRAVSLADVHAAVGNPAVFGIGLRDPSATCPVERAVNRVVSEALAEAERHLLARLRGVAVADVLRKAVRPVRAKAREADPQRTRAHV
jgi:DNA-binding IscR family transcriptional regulator